MRLYLTFLAKHSSTFLAIFEPSRCVWKTSYKYNFDHTRKSRDVFKNLDDNNMDV